MKNINTAISIDGIEQSMANGRYVIRFPRMLAIRMPRVMNSWKQEPRAPLLLAVAISLT